MSTQSSEIKQQKAISCKDMQSKQMERTVSSLDSQYPLKSHEESPIQDYSENQGPNIRNNPKRASSYANITYDTRYNFVQEVNNTKCTIKCAAKKYKINFSTAKAIMQIYRREGRIGKKQKRETKKRQRCSSSDSICENIEIKIEEEHLEQGSGQIQLTNTIKNQSVNTDQLQDQWTQLLKQQQLYYLQIQSQQAMNFQIWNFQNWCQKFKQTGQQQEALRQLQSMNETNTNVLIKKDGVKLEQN